MYEKSIPIEIDTYIYVNMSVYKKSHIDTDWKYPMIPIEKLSLSVYII